jgi:hypothetical protein
MGADASIDLELNAKQLYQELATAEKRYTQGMDRIGAGTNRVAGAHENLLRSNHRVARQFENFSKDMLSGADASQLFATGLEGVGRSLNLSLGALAGIGIGAVAIEKFHELHKEYKKINEEHEKLMRAPQATEFDSLSNLQTRLANVRKELEALNKEAKGDGFAQRIREWFVSGDPLHPFTNPRREERNRHIDQDKRAEADATIAINRKAQGDLADRQAALDGEPDYLTKAKKLSREAAEHASEGLDALVNAMNELEMSFKEMAASIASKRRDRVQRTLGEIASTPDVATAGMTYDDWKSGQSARMAQSWDSEAERRRLNGDMQGAQDAMNYSTDIKRSIPGLKDSEKDLKGEFKGALDESQVLKEIRTNTARQFLNR